MFLHSGTVDFVGSFKDGSICFKNEDKIYDYLRFLCQMGNVVQHL